MNKHLHNILIGASRWWPEPRDYIHPTGGGFAQDAKAMKQDFESIGRDMREAIDKAEKPNDSTTTN